ncbi:protein NPAT isoform X2 [Poeciliopsis prolifica]|uniref:protein NPAT isoform X2 n=1 Tax=Poeciliopsis prolifica TaxID=188132 RepID=UPI0024130023|nr:protein NPAT isoform X2 [Poeciliopsis prolifica]
MLLPSDVARLVLGYLQEEGLSATSQAFIHESPNLKEYAEHTAGDGVIPACVFSIFGKGLTAILNEYVAAKAKDSGHEVPLVMTSLWKKLDFTLNQIKSLQNSPSISASQRIRSRVGVANVARQRVLTVASPSGVVCSSVSESSSFISPTHTTHSMLGHSTPVSFTNPQTRPTASSGAQQPVHDGNRLLSTPRDSPVQVIVSEHRLTSGPVSPGRRKWDTPRKRSGLTGSGGPGKSAMTAANVTTDVQSEEVVKENFPQLVIQNARDKILGDRALQEKLAENINKILASDAVPQTSKASSSAVEPDQSIDEILGLEGEIHMSDDAIHDILEQTESDPAFQALFDLFDYHKTKNADGDAGDGSNACISEENETAGLPSAVHVLQSCDPGPSQSDGNTSDATSGVLKARAGQERKTRKSPASNLLKKTVLDSNGRTSRIENSSARLLVSFSPAAGNSIRKENPSTNSGPQMESDEPLNTPPPPVDSSSTPVTLSNSESLSRDPVLLTEERPASNVDGNPEISQATGLNNPADGVDGAASGDQHEVQVNNTSPNQPDVCVSGGDGLAVPPGSVPSSSSASVSAAAPVTAASITVSASSAFSSSCAPVTPTPSPPPPPVTIPAIPPRKPGEPSNIVSLEIIVSDNQDGDSSRDTAFNQAVSTISGDKIPTIYLSSPAKSPVCPATPKANFDEAAQAVSSLQRSEGGGSPFVSKPGGVYTSPVNAASQGQQRYMFQPAVDPPPTPASFFLVVPTPDVQARPVLLPAGVPNGQPLPTNQHGVTTPSYSTGPALILPSPVKPVVLPVSVLGQNTVGSIQVVSNQIVDVTVPKSIQTREGLKPKPTTIEPKQSTKSGCVKNVTAAAIQPKPSGQKDAAKGSSESSHRRILRFDSSLSEVRSQTTRTAGTPTHSASNTSQHTPQTERNTRPAGGRTKPAILGSSKPKRRVETVRCSADPKGGANLLKETVPLQTQQKDSVKKTPCKQMHIIHDQEFQNARTDNKAEKSQPREASADGLHRLHDDGSTAKDACSSRSLSSDSSFRSGSRKDNEESSRKEAGEKASLKPREGRMEKRTSSQENPNVRANKENEMKGGSQDKQQSSTPSSSASRDFSPPAAPQAKPKKSASKTSSLAKQAAEMLQDLQGLSSPPPPGRKAAVSSSDHLLSGSDHVSEATADYQRTPSRQKHAKNAEGTPKQMLPPNTPDVPTCSPASEAGSENSINMAAHTLMILSRAAIARTGTPLKDSLRQEEVGEKSPSSSKSKKRKQSPVRESPSAKRERKRSPSIKKDKERKKLIDCFPHDLDVDKFLSSLHYDE